MKRLILGLSMVFSSCGDDDARGELDGGSLDAGTTPAQDSGPDAHTDAATLCSKYGGAAGVERAIKQYVIEELATDCAVGLHFTMLPSDRLARFADCLSYQAQELFACPGATYAGKKSPNGKPCRDMKSAHAGLGLSTGDFDAVLADVAGGLLKAGVAPVDLQQLTPALLGLEGDIVESPAPWPSLACDDAGAPSTDAGGADAGG